MTYSSPTPIIVLDKNSAVLQSGRETVAAVLIEAGTKHTGGTTSTILASPDALACIQENMPDRWC